MKEIEDLARRTGFELGFASARYEWDSKFEAGRKEGIEQGRKEERTRLEKKIKYLQSRLNSANMIPTEKARLCLNVFNLEKPTATESDDKKFWLSFSGQVENKFRKLVKIVHPDHSGENESSGMYRALNDCREYLRSYDFKNDVKKM